MRGPRIFLRVFSGALAGLLLASCGPGNQNFLANGPGAQLEANDIAATQIRSEDYFKFLCKQSGILPSHSGKSYSCLPHPGDSRHWMLLTHQGLNDIDRRCDSYLQWLDHKKRSKAPILSQIGAIDTATTAILGATGVSGAPLTIVAAGFGLLRNSVENYHSRLLLEIESSTINSVVLNEQHRFREKLRSENVVVDNKPAAEHVLRSYLRICLPFSIETSINNFSTLGSKGIQVTDRNSINWSPVVGSRLIEDIPARGSVETVKKTETDEKDNFVVKSVNLSPDERALAGSKTPEVIQNALCVEADGIFGPSTRSAIVAAKNGLRQSAAQIPGIQADDSDTLNTSLIDFFSQKTDSCFNHVRGYKNSYEKYALNSEARMLQFQTMLDGCLMNIKSLADNKVPFEVNLNPSGSYSLRFDTNTRQAIEAARRALTQQTNPLKEDFASDEVTQKLFIALSTNCRGLNQSNFQQPN